MKRWLLFLSMALLAGLLVFADGDDRFKGGSFDGYDDNTITNSTIPAIPGTIFGIR